MARTATVICDRCGKCEPLDHSEAQGANVITFRVRAVVNSDESGKWGGDLCLDCVEAVQDQITAIMGAKAPKPAHYVPKWGPITYQDCGCDVRDHAPGECAKTTVMPPKGFAPAAPLPMCGECGRHHSPGHCAFFPEQPRAPFSNCTMASCESPLNCCEAGKCCG